MIICPKCGTTNEDGAEFCRACGTPLAVAEMPAKQTLPVKYPWLLKLYGLIFVVICVAICGGFVAKGVSAARANRSKPAVDSKSSAPAETGASSRAETSRAEASSHSSQTADYKEQEIWGNSAANVVDAYKRRYKEVVKYDPELTLQEKLDRDDGGARYIYKAKDGFEISIFTKGPDSVYCIEIDLPKLLWTFAENAKDGLMSNVYTFDLFSPAILFEESISSWQDFDKYLEPRMGSNNWGPALSGDGYYAQCIMHTDKIVVSFDEHPFGS